MNTCVPFVVAVVGLAAFSVVVVDAAQTAAAAAAPLCSVCRCTPATSSAECRDLAALTLEREKGMSAAFGRVHFHNVSRLTLREGSFRVPPDAALNLTLSHVDRVILQSGSLELAARSSSLSLDLSDVRAVHVAGRAFDVLRRAQLDDVASLHLAPEAFKPRVQWRAQPDLELSFSRVRHLPHLPPDAFASARFVELTDCAVGEVAGRAFDAIQIENVTFRGCSLDRVQADAFPERLLVNRLTFDNCTLTALSAGAVQSAMSTFNLTGTTVSSMSQESVLLSHVARVHLTGNRFRTLGNRSLVFRSWTNFAMTDNDVEFMEQGTLSGLSDPGPGANASFAFENNYIAGVNRGSLQHGLTREGVGLAVVRGNRFGRDCDCDFVLWLGIVCGSSGSADALDLSGMIKNTSLCRVDEAEASCFPSRPFAPVQDYLEQVCSSGQGCGQESGGGTNVIRLIEEQMDVRTNKGILLVLLLFALLASLLLILYTLCRWLVYKLQLRMLAKAKQDDQWNFTKIEERRPMNELDEAASSPATDHYESLAPLEEEEEEEEDAADRASTHTAHSHVGATEEGMEMRERKRPDVEVEEVKPEPKPPQPQLTFYDEMIGLLKERLDDPDNYGTVADVDGPATATADQQPYQDPFEVRTRPA